VYIGDPADGNILLEPAAAAVGVTVSGSAFPQPHLGKPIKLTKTQLKIAIGAEILQAGLQGDPPLIHDGMQVPSNLTFVLAGVNTAEKQHVFTASATQTIHVKNGQAQPLTAVVPLPDTTWHPSPSTANVVFGEKSMTITAGIQLGTLAATAVFDCHPAPRLLLSPPIVYKGVPPPTPPTTAEPTLTPAAVTTTTMVVTDPTQTGSGGSGSLPRTGASWVLLLVVAGAAIDIGIALIGATRRRHRA
jgi:hypothetical protein